MIVLASQQGIFGHTYWAYLQPYAYKHVYTSYIYSEKKQTSIENF